MASKEQLRKLRQKHKLGEYSLKSRKRKTSKPLYKRKSNLNMAKKTKTRYITKIKKAYRKSKPMFSGIFNEVTGVSAVALGEDMFVNMLPEQVKPHANLIEAGLGYWLKSKSGIIGVAGKTMFYSKGKEVVKNLLSGVNIFGSANVQGSNNGWN